MRLKNVESGHTLGAKIKLGVIRVASRQRIPDVVRVLTYRPEYYGKHFSALVQDTLRGPSDWTVGERELFASFTSKMNDCEF